MAKSVTVTFDDGTNHTYDNVPDEVTDDQITARAGQDFTDKSVSGISGGAAPAPMPQATQNANGPVAPGQDLSLGQKTIGALATGANLIAEHPAIAAGAAGLYKANKMANTWMAAKNAEMQAAKQIAAQRAASMAGHQNIQQQKINLRAGLPPEGAPSPILDASGNPMSAARTPVTGMSPAAPTVPEAAPSSSNYMARVTQLADQYLPAKASIGETLSKAGDIMGKVGKLMSSAPAIGAQLMLHSPNLNENEQQMLQQRQQMPPTITGQ